MKQTSDYNEDVKYGMNKFFLLANAVKYSAYRISHAACEKEKAAAEAEDGKYDLSRADYAPAHHQIADEWRNFIFFKADRIENDTDSGHSPLYPEYSPTERGIVFTERAQRKRRVCSCNKQKYRAVIEHAKNALGAKPWRKTVIDRRNGIQNDHSRAEDRRADNAPYVAEDRRENNG